MITGHTDISEVTNYRTLLAERLKRLKAIDSKFSHRYINRRLGARSDGWFADVLAGRQKLKPGQTALMAEVLKLDPRERELVQILVELESARTPADRVVAYGKWLELKGFAIEAVERDRFRYFGRWYYPVLRELLLISPFDGDYAALGARLVPPITARQARDAVGVLERLGLLNPDAPAPVLVKRPGKTPHWSKIMGEYAELAAPAMKRFNKDQRDFSTVVLSLSPEGLKAVGEEIAILRRRLLAIAERDAGTRRVYQVLIQAFPLSHSPEGTHE